MMPAHNRCRYPVLVTLKVAVLAMSMLVVNPAIRAAMLDEETAQDPLLLSLAEAAAAADLDLLHNLNDRGLARRHPDRPRLGRLPDLPIHSLPDSDALNAWETGFAAGELAGLALSIDSAARGGGATQTAQEFLQHWLHRPAENRVFITFVASDRDRVQALVTALVSDAQWQFLLLDNHAISLAGNLYATAAVRLAIDSRQARRYLGDVPELAWLGERVRRNSDSIFRGGDRGGSNLSRLEPSVFEKESLGDEYSESTIREIVVPGGVALGETASLPPAVSAVRFRGGALELVDNEANSWRLPAIAPAELKALFDFVQRSEAIASDAIVDIDGDGRVRISAALRDTDAGYAIMQADTVPFAYVRNLRVIKSVMIDTAVDWRAEPDSQALHYDTDFEVRFLSADNMRIAQTRVALEYGYASDTGITQYRDAWGRDSGRLAENLDFPGLGREVAIIARYAGWIALWRAIHEQHVQFTVGRYEFMKLDKSGRETPARF